MIPKQNEIVIFFVLCATFHYTTGNSIVNKRSANDSDNDNYNDDDNGMIDFAKDVINNIMVDLERNENVFDEAMKNISNEIDKYIDLVPDEDKEESTKVETIDGFDVKTKNTVINGTIGSKDAKLQIQQIKVLGKHKEEGTEDEDKSIESSELTKSGTGASS